MLYETRMHIHNKRMLIAQGCVKFAGRSIAQHRFLVNLADFPDVVWVKNSRFRSVGGVWNLQHLLCIIAAAGPHIGNVYTDLPCPKILTSANH